MHCALPCSHNCFLPCFCHFLSTHRAISQWIAQKVNNKNYGASDTEGNDVYVCVLGELLRGRRRAVKGHIVDVKASEHQRADSGCVGSLFLPLTHQTHTHSFPLSPLKTLKNITVYCSCLKPKKNIWSWRVNLVLGQGANNNMTECERVKYKDNWFFFSTLHNTKQLNLIPCNILGKTFRVTISHRIFFSFSCCAYPYFYSVFGFGLEIPQEITRWPESTDFY